MKQVFICTHCGHVVERNCEGNSNRYGENVCPICGEREMMLLEDDDINLKALTAVNVDSDSVESIVIPDNKALCTSMLGNLATLRAAVASLYELQSQIDRLQRGIVERIGENRDLKKNIEKLKRDIEYDKNYDVNSLFYEDIGSESDIAQVRATLLSAHKAQCESQDMEYARKREKKFKLLNILGTIFVVLAGFAIAFLTCFGRIMSEISEMLPIPLLCSILPGVAFFFITLRLARKNKYNHNLAKREAESENEYLQNQYQSDLEANLSARRQAVNNKISAKRKELQDNIYECQHKISECEAKIASNNRENIIALADVLALKKALKSEVRYLDGLYRGMIHKSDWENLDYIIYVFVTGRADDLKEALHMVDEQRRAEMIVDVIGMAAMYLSENISSALSSLRSDLSNSIYRISADLSSMRNSLELQNREYMRDIHKVVDLDKKLCDYNRQSYEMMKSINDSLKEL